MAYYRTGGGSGKTGKVVGRFRLARNTSFTFTCEVGDIFIATGTKDTFTGFTEITDNIPTLTGSPTCFILEATTKNPVYTVPNTSGHYTDGVLVRLS